MADREEQRRAPRTVVDVEAVLHLNGLKSYQGVIRDLSSVGSLFVPQRPIEAPRGRGSMRFPLPTSDHWLEPTVEVRRLTTFTRTGGEAGQGIGLEFSGLTPQQEQAVAEGCREWDGHRMRQYDLSARCYVQSEGGLTQYARFGQLAGGTRSYVRLKAPTGPGLDRGSHVRLKIARSWVAGEVEKVTPDGAEVDILVRLEGWGRDFFLYEARRAG